MSMGTCLFGNYKPSEDGKWGPNIHLSVILQLIRAAFCWMISGKSTSKTTTLSRASSACKRKYNVSNPAPNDRI